MAETSKMIPLGTKALSFNLPDTISGEMKSLEELKSDVATVVMFICNHCPYVVHVQGQLVQLAQDYDSKGVSFVAISSNDPANYPDDAPDKMKEVGLKLGYPFPYLFDETQEVAKAYNAVCTPDTFIFDGDVTGARSAVKIVSPRMISTGSSFFKSSSASRSAVAIPVKSVCI